METQVLAVTSGKGGVGKTTTAVNLAVALHDRDRSVAIVDADLGMANVASFLGIDHEPTLHAVLTREADVDDAVVEPADGFGVLAGDDSLEGFASADPDELATVLDRIADRYEYVLLDTGGGLSYEGVLPTELADAVVLVTTPGAAAVGDTQKSAALADRLDVPVRGAILTRTNDDTDAAGIAADLDAELLGAVPEDPAVPASADDGIPIASIDRESTAAAAYDRIADALVDGAAPEGDAAVAERAVGDATAERTTESAIEEENDSRDDEPENGVDRPEAERSEVEQSEMDRPEAERSEAEEKGSVGLFSRFVGAFR